MACALMPTNYFVVVVLPSRQIKRVARLTACNYERCVIFVTIFSGLKIRLRRLQTITLGLKRFNRFKDQNTRWDSIYRHMCGMTTATLIQFDSDYEPYFDQSLWIINISPVTGSFNMATPLHFEHCAPPSQ